MDKDREEFEAACDIDGIASRRHKNMPDQYANWDTQCKWIGWQAAKAQTRTQAAGVDEKELANSLEVALTDHRLIYSTVNDGSGNGLPLVDALTPDHDSSIERGKYEINLLVDDLVTAIRSHLRSPLPVVEGDAIPSQAEGGLGNAEEEKPRQCGVCGFLRDCFYCKTKGDNHIAMFPATPQPALDSVADKSCLPRPSSPRPHIEEERVMTQELRVLINQLENINHDIGVSGACKKVGVMADLIRERTALRGQLEEILAQEQQPAMDEREYWRTIDTLPKGKILRTSCNGRRIEEAENGPMVQAWHPSFSKPQIGYWMWEVRHGPYPSGSTRAFDWDKYHGELGGFVLGGFPAGYLGIMNADLDWKEANPFGFSPTHWAPLLQAPSLSPAEATTERVGDLKINAGDILPGNLVAVPIEQMEDIHARFRRLAKLGQWKVSEWDNIAPEMRKLKSAIFAQADFGALHAGNWVQKANRRLSETKEGSD